MKQMITRANQKGWTEQSQAILNDIASKKSEDIFILFSGSKDTTGHFLLKNLKILELVS